jgi:hypothetical protein
MMFDSRWMGTSVDMHRSKHNNHAMLWQCRSVRTGDNPGAARGLVSVREVVDHREAHADIRERCIKSMACIEM